MTPHGELTTLIQIMDQLRAPGGCPWVAIQTHESLSHYAVEEAYEVAEAAETGDLDQLREELGDLLLQVVFHARIAQESPDGFDTADVIRTLSEKLIRRNPHVFGTNESLTLEEVEAQWEAVKQAEKPQRAVTEGIPRSLPALMRAQKIYSRLENSPAQQKPQSQQDAQAHQNPQAHTHTEPDVVPEETPDAVSIGEELWNVVAKAQRLGVDAEKALRDVTRRREASLGEI